MCKMYNIILVSVYFSIFFCSFGFTNTADTIKIGDMIAIELVTDFLNFVRALI